MTDYEQGLRGYLNSIEDQVFRLGREVLYVNAFETIDTCDFDGSEVYRIELHLELGPYSPGESE